MTAGTAVFLCNICGEPSAEICAYCTKDACANHRCARCKRCSDCCECEVPLSATEVQEPEPEAVAEPAPAAETAEAPQPEAPQPDAPQPDAPQDLTPDEGMNA